MRLVLLIALASACSSFVSTKDEHVFVTDEKFKSYHLEDFFWTGSGDGPEIEDSFGNETETRQNEIETESEAGRVTTVFHTTTILFATIYPNPGSCGQFGCTPQISPVFTESIDFSSPASTTVRIQPTPTQPQPRTADPDGHGPSPPPPLHTRPAATPPRPQDGVTEEWPAPGLDDLTTSSGLEISELPATPATVPPDQRYWLLTVLRMEEGPELRTSVLEDRLARLYQRAFMRRRREDTGQVQVTIYNATASGLAPARDVGIVYTVSVGGHPVAALAAAADMRLLTLSEVSAELGYPVLTKAEPYLKGVVPYGARVKGRSRDTWLLIGSVVAAVSLLVVLAAIFTLGLSKKRAQRSARGAANRSQVYTGEEGNHNIAFIDDVHKDGLKSNREGTVTFADQRRGSTSSSSCSGSSETSLVRLRMQQKRRDMKRDETRPKPRPRTRISRVHDATAHHEDEAGLAGSRETILEDDIDSYRGGDGGRSPAKTSTPTSYLSMPSVKAFPRKARIPESLNRVLEPISIRHLDEDEEEVPTRVGQGSANKGVTRHGSLEADDPGVIGPVVWDRHCQHINAIRDEEMGGVGGSGGSIGRMRRRFNQLLDDTFAPQPPDKQITTNRVPDFRSKSAVTKPEESLAVVFARPKTTDNKRPFTAVSKTPRGAWATPHCLTPNRPLSAGPNYLGPKPTDSPVGLKPAGPKPVDVFDGPECAGPSHTPVINPQLILVDGELSPSDPAVPLIAAIKEELKKFQSSESN